MAQILIVDDSKMQSRAMAQVLEKQGHEVSCVHSGEEAVKEALHLLPDVIVMDVVMPGKNGFQATREITRHKFTEHIPIVLVSGKSQETDRAWGERQGAKGYLVKPVPDEQLVAVIDSMLEQYS